MKDERQRAILLLIQQQAVGDQNTLLHLLRERGFPVTQATVSRDIRDLRLVKRADAAGEIRYQQQDLLPETDLFTRNILSVGYAGNTAVIKCGAGTAQAVCAMLDETPRPDVVGTLAGDDTIFVLLRSNELTKRFAAELKQKIRSR